MEALIIGLDHNYRGAELEEQLSGYGVPFKRSPGVLVDALPGMLDHYVDQWAAMVLQRRELTKGEVGCALAHRNAWRTLVESEERFTLVFEDDARLTGRPITAEIMAALDTDEPTLIVLDSYVNYTIVARGQSGRVLRALVPPPGAWAYALNRAAAVLMIEDGARISSVADWPARVAHKVAFHAVYPQLAYVDERVESNLEGDRHIQEVGGTERGAVKALRLAQTLGHVRWVRNRHAYNGYRNYWNHEIRRVVINRVARRLGKRRNPEDTRSLLVAR
ncbi:hypothetical protein GCM10023346_17110 [Arthrobacter gyeryongensis]|uniref:Glycosyl transferase family 25 domain-containing protein n=1 Tax=Arthrobacter gyeryongensis TaxID=1650592 RepID=A0ABP9SAH0_9MICC